jgi:hypothetical protein
MKIAAAASVDMHRVHAGETTLSVGVRSEDRLKTAFVGSVEEVQTLDKRTVPTRERTVPYPKDTKLGIGRRCCVGADDTRQDK